MTENEVEVVEKLRAKGECTTSLAMTQELLSRCPDDAMRTRLLFNILYCSTRLELNDVTDAALRS